MANIKIIYDESAYWEEKVIFPSLPGYSSVVLKLCGKNYTYNTGDVIKNWAEAIEEIAYSSDQDSYSLGVNPSVYAFIEKSKLLVGDRRLTRRVYPFTFGDYLALKKG